MFGGIGGGMPFNPKADAVILSAHGEAGQHPCASRVERARVHGCATARATPWEAIQFLLGGGIMMGVLG